MSEWDDIMSTRADAEVMAEEAANDPKLMQHEAFLYALLAIRLELRALALGLDYTLSGMSR